MSKFQFPYRIILISSILLGIWFSQSSCKREDELLDKNPVSALRFSEDTLYFDTVFTTQKTATYRLKVYNPNPKSVRIDAVFLNGVNGKFPFSFHINGRFGPSRVENVELLGKDSAYVLVSATIDAKNDNLPFLVLDSLTFLVNGRPNPQKVHLVAYGQDAVYYRNQNLDCNMIWTKERPIIIMDTVTVAQGCTLTVEPGTRVYGFNSAALLVRGTLLILGTPEDTITFQGWRRESYYSRVPGQWFGIWFFNTSSGNQIQYALIKNAYRAIQVGEVGKIDAQRPNLLIFNSRIQNVVDYGILGLQSVIFASGNQIADCGEIAFAGYQGGFYEFMHNTIGESGNNPFRRETPLVAITDHFPPNENWNFGAPLYSKLVNNIINGGESNELNLVARTGAPFETYIFGNLIKSKDYDYFQENSTQKMNLKIITTGRFQDALKYNFRPDTTVFSMPLANGIGLDTLRSRILPKTELNFVLKTDIANKPRPISTTIKPDIGCYQLRP